MQIIAKFFGPILLLILLSYPIMIRYYRVSACFMAIKIRKKFSGILPDGFYVRVYPSTSEVVLSTAIFSLGGAGISILAYFDELIIFAVTMFVMSIILFIFFIIESIIQEEREEKRNIDFLMSKNS